jgi:hypothetical protein
MIMQNLAQIAPGEVAMERRILHQIRGKLAGLLGLKPSSSEALNHVFERESIRIHCLALEIDKLAPAERHERLYALQQWERLQVLDEIRHRRLN